MCCAFFNSVYYFLHKHFCKKIKTDLLIDTYENCFCSPPPSPWRQFSLRPMYIFFYILQQSLLRQLKTRRVFNAFNQSTVFQEGVRDFLSLSFLRPEDVPSAVTNHILPQFEFVSASFEDEEQRHKVQLFLRYVKVII